VDRSVSSMERVQLAMVAGWPVKMTTLVVSRQDRTCIGPMGGWNFLWPFSGDQGGSDSAGDLS